MNDIPKSILNDIKLNKAISVLPPNYNFEIYKSIWKLRNNNSKRVALQFPEGLLVFSLPIADIIEKFVGCETVILGDVTYGACCIDDFTANTFECDFLIHYGHSCLVPTMDMKISVLYIFVQITIDINHLIETLKFNFLKKERFILAGTIQFASSLFTLKNILSNYFENMLIPQIKPLSSGEVIGCTSPCLEKNDTLVFIADGRFHLESMMIHNSDIISYRYNPYIKQLTVELYSFEKMRNQRRCAIEEAKNATSWGIILSSLGRQGNSKIYIRLINMIQNRGLKFTNIILSEISSEKLDYIVGLDVFVHVSCPRISIDWGHEFCRPILNPYEANVALQEIKWKNNYPMDFYSKKGGIWANYWSINKDKKDLTKKQFRKQFYSILKRNEKDLFKTNIH